LQLVLKKIADFPAFPASVVAF